MDEKRGLEREWKRSWGVGFDAVPDAYDAARPGYPAALYRDLKKICDLDSGTRTLEIGCGTGQATRDLAPEVASILALEPGKGLAKKARERLSQFQNVEVLQTTFKDFEGETGTFDLLISATAFHWVDPDIGFTRAVELLRSGGWLALWWTSYHDPDEDDLFGEEASPLFGAYRNSGDFGTNYGLSSEDRVADFEESGAFGPVETRRYRWKGHHSAEEVRMLISTYSNMQALEEWERLRILDVIEEIATEKFGGQVARPYVTALYAAQKR